MQAWFSDWRKGQGLVPLLLLCALVMKLAVPAGFMPSFEVGRVGLVVCSAEGSREMAVDLGSTEKAPGSSHQDDAPCVFATGLGGGLTPAELAVAPDQPALREAVAARRAIADLTPHRLAAPPPPALAPPARA